MEAVTARKSLSPFHFKFNIVPLQPQAPERPSQLSLFCAASLEIYQVAKWCRASPENTLSDLQIVNDPKDLILKDDGMALCLYDDTMKVWSTTRDWALQWREVGQRIAEAIEKNPTIQDSWDENTNFKLRNFREAYVDENGSVQAHPSPFILANSLNEVPLNEDFLDEEVKRMEVEFINLPYDSDEDEPQAPQSPLSDISDAVSTPPLSPDSASSPCGLPGSLELESPSSPTLSLSPVCRTVSPSEIFSPLPQAEDLNTMELEVPPTPLVPTQPLPELDITSPTSPNPPPSRSLSPPVAGPSRRSDLKRPRWSEDESNDENDEFIPERWRAARPGKRTKVGSHKRAKAKLEGRGTRCDLCGKHLGRATDLPRHRASCKANPERVERATPCEICGKLLPVRTDAIKRHRASKTCRSKRQNGDDEDPHLSES